MASFFLGGDHGHGARPRPEHERLLRAALLPGEAGRDAYRAWRARTRLDALDGPSLRLLPLLARNLRELGLRDPDEGRLHGYRRHAWTTNQLLFHRAGEVLRGLAAAGIDALVLKGAGLAIRHYADPGLRPMGDVDILVPLARARAAMDVLRALGLRALARFPERLVEVLHATPFAFTVDREAGPGVDLHWHSLWDGCRPGADDDFWAAAVPVRIGGVETRTLAPADMLLHVCVHGTAWSASPSVRWVADALTVLRAPGGALDWDRLVAGALARRLALRVRVALGYLRERFDAPVPGEALARLRSARVSSAERIEHWARTRPMRGLTSLVAYWLLHGRRAAPAGLWRRMAGFPRFLQHAWDIERLRDLPFHVAYRAARRVRIGLADAASRVLGTRGGGDEARPWMRECASG